MRYNKIDEEDMKSVLNGDDILIKLPNECDYHYQEKNWNRYSEKEQLLIKKWIRFMFNKSKNINNKISSYGLKHSCESCLGFYIHNDAIKKAMLLEKFIAKTEQINWHFNINGKITTEKENKFKEVFQEELKEEN